MGRPVADGPDGRAMVVFCPYCKKPDLAGDVSGVDSVDGVGAVPAAWPRLVNAVRAAGASLIELPPALAVDGSRISKTSWSLRRVTLHCHPDDPVRVDVERCGHGVACPLCGRVEPLRRRAA